MIDSDKYLIVIYLFGTALLMLFIYDNLNQRSKKMSGECKKCHEHCLDFKCDEIKRGDYICIQKQDLIDLIHWSRRYCDGRATYAAHGFNQVYKKIRSQNPDFLRCMDEFDETLKDKGAYWPYAQDGMYNKETGSYDATK